ncbi:uncharacterized protein LOC113557470 [Rhopalosiphum maidis]|uniref:uncharacterized protein LOC113557470 n=1 Tax=Rhopalosiphum maidis TaxID=43146 RepID=UPI000EFF403F|nr:uncharacterized protein LOC113557470 [Rhopalosiphum maidis]
MFWLVVVIFATNIIYENAVPVAAVIDDPSFDHHSGSAEDRSYLKYLEKQLEKIMENTSTGRTAVVSTLDAAPGAVPRRSSLFSDGFFIHYRQPCTIEKKPAARRRVTQRPKNATIDDSKSSTTASAAPILFVTNGECESANPGRACVCRMTDLLDLVVQRLDEAVMSADDDEDGRGETAALSCRSFRPVPAKFVVYPATAATDGDGTTASATDATVAAVPADAAVVERKVGKTGGRRSQARVRGRIQAEVCLSRVRSGVGAVEDAVKATPMWKQIDFNDVLNYRLERSSIDAKGDHYAVQYGLVGSDVKVQCVISNDGTKMNSFKWDFKLGKHKTNSTVTGTDMNILLILGMEPGDSKNYTCIATTDVVGNSKNGSSYKHYVIAVEKAIYEIRGSAVYKTRDGGGCTHELTVHVQKQLPSSMRTELCSEGSSRYACNVIMEKPKCAEDERTMEIKYLVTLNDKSNYLAQIRTNKKGRIALRYQKLLAKISSVISSNLNKTMTVPIMSKLSLIETNFEPDRMSTKNFVSCSSGFGIREVFCAACPPHHYSPDKSIECFKCAKGFRQPVAGSDKCVKCTNIFSSGCYMNEVSPTVYYVTYLIFFLVLLFMACFCAFYGREKNEQSIKIMPRKIKKIFKKKNKYSLLTQMEDTADSGSVLSKSYGKLKNLLKFKKKSKSEIINSKIKFNYIHKNFGQQIQNNNVTEENSTTN